MNTTDRTRRGHLGDVVIAAGLGALAMYLLDPQQGRRRKALARDQAVHAARKTGELADMSLRDLAHRASGLVAELRAAVRSDAPSDPVLVERVRAKLGRWVSHPHAMRVTAAAGRVTLAGPILRSEERGLLRGLRRVRGVRAIDNRLEPHDSAGNIPALQGGNGRVGPRREFMQANWAPGPRLLGVAGGSALAAYGFGHRGLGGSLIGVAGLALALRAVANKELARTLGFAGGRRAIDLRKTIHIAAPPERVFELWSDVGNFPHFMSLVEEVRAIDETHSHWVVKGPAGVRLEWDSVITERVPPQLLAWRSEPGAPVQHSGIVHFEADGAGTRVAVQMSYHPPGGVMGHAAAALLGRDPKREMDADLLRMKSFIETGIAPHDASKPNGGARRAQAVAGSTLHR